MRPTVEEMRRAMERGTLVVVSCALASGPLLGADYTRGPNCILCGREVQVSPRGVRQVRAGALLTCNECGISLAEDKQKAGGVAAVMLSPEAEAAIERGNARLDPKRIEGLTGRTFPAWNNEAKSCAFCSATPANGLWLYPHKPFDAHAIAEDGSKVLHAPVEGDWAACDSCACFFDKGRLNVLVEKAIQALGVEADDLTRQVLRTMFAMLAETRNGPRKWADLRRASV